VHFSTLSIKPQLLLYYVSIVHDFLKVLRAYSVAKLKEVCEKIMAIFATREVYTVYVYISYSICFFFQCIISAYT